MNIFGRTLAAVGAIVLTATAVALPDVCELKAPVASEFQSTPNSDISQSDDAVKVLPANG